MATKGSLGVLGTAHEDAQGATEGSGESRSRRQGPGAKRIIRVGVLATMLALVSTSTVLGGLISGSLPTTAFTFTSVTDNPVNMTGDGIHLKIKGSANVKTTYTRVPVNPNFFFGWHYHNGPVIVTVTAGTLTYFDASCRTWDLEAGHTYIESTGQVLNVTTVPAKNVGVSTVEWFTTRLYPEGTADPVNVDPPCTP